MKWINCLASKYKVPLIWKWSNNIQTTNCYNRLPKLSILCDNRASNVCKLYDSASIPLASVFLKCISYSSSKRDVGDPGVGVTFGWFYEQTNCINMWNNNNDLEAHYLMMMLMATAHSLLAVRLILIGIAVTRTWRRCITLIVEHYIVRWWRTIQTASLPFQFQI